MKNFVESGDNLDLLAPEDGVISGVPLVINSMFIVPKNTATEGHLFVGVWRGVFRFTIDESESADQLTPAYWDSAESRVTSVADGNRPIGLFVEPVETGSTDVNVLLTGILV